MFKNIIAAFAALALLPCVGLAATSSLSKSSEKVFSYTIRAKDTDRTTLLSTNGATECSYVAQIIGGATLTLTGDAAEAVSASGSGTIATTGGEFSAQFDTVSSSNVIVTCNPAGSGGSSTPATTVDADGDGIYEYVKFPQDFDGDGTTWQTCECGGGTTPGYTADYICGTFRTSDADFTQVNYSGDDGAGNPAECRFEGQRVWDDASDDLNALYAQTGANTVIEFEPGTFAMKGGDVPTSDSGVHVSTQCWDSTAGTYSDTCQDDGTGRTLRVAAEFPHSGTRLTGAGVDPNGDMDLKYEGTMFVSNNGPRTFWNTNTVSNGIFQIGRAATGGTSITNQVEFSYGLNTSDTEESILCLDSTTVAAQMEEGELWQLTMTHPENGRLLRSMAYVTDVTATACGSTGVEVKFGGAAAQAIDIASADGGIYQTSFGAKVIPATTSYVVEVLNDQLAVGIKVSELWFTHLDYIGAGNCTMADVDAAECDTGVSLVIGGGFNHSVSNIGVIQTSASFGSGQVINTYVASTNVTLEDSLFRYNQGGLVDVAQYMAFRDNTVIDNSLIRNVSYDGITGERVSFIRQQGDHYVIEGNKFLRNAIPTENLLTDTKMSNTIVELGGFQGIVRDNIFRVNTATCVALVDGARQMLIEGNIFECGTLNANVSITEERHDAGFALVINSKSNAKTGEITVRGNQFVGSGGHYVQQISLNRFDPRAHVVLTGLDFNATLGADGDYDHPIMFLDNTVTQIDDLWSHFVIMRIPTTLSDANGDPDASDVIFDRNYIDQGNLFGLVEMNGDTGLAGVEGLDPDENDDGIGLATCGVNYLGGVPTLTYVNAQPDDQSETVVASGANLLETTPGLGYYQSNDQCDSYLD